ncbi:MAG: hypothetical protein ACO37E_13290, partial [Lutimaribacter sp.]
QLDMVQDKQMIADRDSQNLLDTIDDNGLDKILIAARSTKQHGAVWVHWLIPQPNAWIDHEI